MLFSSFLCSYAQLEVAEGDYISLNGRQITFPLTTDVSSEADVAPSIDNANKYVAYVRVYRDESDDSPIYTDLRLHNVGRKSDEILLHNCFEHETNRAGIKCYPDIIVSAAITADGSKIFYSYVTDKNAKDEDIRTAVFDMENGEITEMKDKIYILEREGDYIIGEIQVIHTDKNSGEKTPCAKKVTLDKNGVIVKFGTESCG